MRKLNVLFTVAVVAFLALSGQTASAQDDAPVIELSGDDVIIAEDGDETTYTVPVPGTYEVTVDASAFSLEVFVLECPGAGGSIEALEAGDPTTLCNLATVITASPDDDGTFSVTFEAVEVGACGLVFGAGDLAQTESASALLAVEDPGEPVVCEVVESEGYDTDEVANTEGDDAEVAGVSVESGGGTEALATTGLSSGWLAGVALVVTTAGGLILFEGRRLARRRAN